MLVSMKKKFRDLSGGICDDPDGGGESQDFETWIRPYGLTGKPSFIFAVFLVLRTFLWEKNKDSCEPRSDLMVLRTVNGFCSSHMSLLKKNLKPLTASYRDIYWILAG